MSDDVNADFGRLQGTAEAGVSSFNAAGQHPVFGAAHSFVLAHKYGQADPYTYMRNPGLRQMDTRQAAMESLQKVASHVKRWRVGEPEQAPPSPTVPTAKPPQPDVQGTYDAFTKPKVPTVAKPKAPPSNWIG